MTTLNSEWAHEILKNFGLDMEARNCLAKNQQLIEIAAIAYLNRGFGALNGEAANKLAKENRLIEAAIAVEKERQLKEKDQQVSQPAAVAADGNDLSSQKTILLERAHRILKSVGLDAEARNCLARNKQLIDIANVVENGEDFRELEKEVLNKLAKEDGLMELSNALKKHTQYGIQIKKAINRLAQTDRLTDIQNAIGKEIRRAIRVESANLTKDICAQYISAARRHRSAASRDLIPRISEIPFISERQQSTVKEQVNATLRAPDDSRKF